MKRIFGLSKLFKNSSLLGLALAAFLLGLFLIVSSEMREAANGEPELLTAIDTYLLHLCFELRQPWLNAVAVDVTALGSTSVVTMLTVVFATFMLLLRKWPLAALMVVASAGSGTLSTALKLFFGRERPTLVEKLVQVQGFSYPSGHSLTAAAVYLTLGLLACRFFPRGSARMVVLALAVGLVLLIGASRVYLGVHYPSDVVAGLLLGSSWALLLAVASTVRVRIA